MTTNDAIFPESDDQQGQVIEGRVVEEAVYASEHDKPRKKKKFEISPEKREEINAAIDEMESLNMKVTIQEVIKFMGKGSSEYVSPVLRDRRNARKPRFSITSELPVPIAEAIDRVGRELWGAASTLADERIHLAQSDAEARREESDLQLVELEVMFSDLSDEHDDLLSEKSGLETLSADQSAEIRHLNERVMDLTELVDTTKTALNDSQNQLKDIERDLKSSEERNAGLQDTLDKNRDTIESLTLKLESAQQELSENLKQAASQQLMLEANQKQLEAKDKKLEELAIKTEEQFAVRDNKIEALELSAREQQAAKDHEIESLETLIDSLKEEAVSLDKQWSTENSKLKTKVAGLEARVEDRCTQVSKLESANQDYKKALKEEQAYRTKFDTAQERIRELSKEGGELKQENKRLQGEVGRLSGKLESLLQTEAGGDTVNNHQK